MKTIVETIDEFGRSRGQALAFWSPRRSWSFAELAGAVNRAAGGLQAAGIGPGDRVGCLTKHTAECVVLTLAANKVGAVCMPVNWRLAPSEIEYIVGNGGARLMVVDDAFLGSWAEVDAPSVEQVLCTTATSGEYSGFADWYATFQPIKCPVSYQPHDTALQLYSSGTTGLPKGVELTHANLASGILGAIPESLGYHGPPSVMLNVLPTYHIAGVGVGLLTSACGGASVLYPDFDPAAVIEAITEHQVTHAFLVPAMIQFLLQCPGVEAGDYGSLQVISYGASPITEPVLLGAMETFKCDFIQVYGLTETTGAVTALGAEDHDPSGERKHLLRSAGRALQDVDIRIVDVESGKPLPDGEVGEVWIRTPQNMKGYWDNPDASAQALIDEPASTTPSPWFRSGDAGYMEHGYLFLHDRIKDMIVSGGENIYPAEVENVLLAHPGVADGAVIGVPHPDWGEAVMACVVPVAGTDVQADEVIAFMRERIAHFKCPRSVTIVDEIPRNPTGKILKRVLRAPWWEAHGRQVN